MGRARIRTIAAMLVLSSVMFLFGCKLPHRNPGLDSSYQVSKTVSKSVLQTTINQPITEINKASEGQLSVFVIDCGQGDSIYAELPDGKNMLIDGTTGSKSGAVLTFLETRGVKKIDIIVATHPHEDHIGGLDDIIDKYDIGFVYMSSAITTTRAFEKLLDAIERKGLEIDIPSSGQYILGDEGMEFYVRCVAPNANSYNDLNNYSIVLLIKYKDRRILLTGDAEIESENEQLSAGYDLKADVIKLGHHGSLTSSSEYYLKAVTPSYAIISCGADNSYGHPHTEVLQRIARLNILLYRTDIHGTVLVQSDGIDMQVTHNGD